MTLPRRSCLVIGASSQLGDSLLPQLLSADYKVHAVSRNAPIRDSHTPGLQWHSLDLQKSIIWPASVSLVVHLAPLYLLPALLRHATEPLRVVAISSTSVRTKLESPSAAERRVAQRLLQAEQEVSQLCQAKGHSLTILRPTMLYGLGRDATIGRMQKFIQRWSFLPVPAMQTGLRQPVHVNDVARAVLKVVNEPFTINKVYELGGRDCLNVHQLARRIFLDNKKSVRVLYIPTWLLSMALMLLKIFRPRLDWSPALLKRAAVDQVVDNQAAVKDFQYEPRAFTGVFPTQPFSKQS